MSLPKEDPTENWRAMSRHQDQPPMASRLHCRPGTSWLLEVALYHRHKKGLAWAWCVKFDTKTLRMGWADSLEDAAWTAAGLWKHLQTPKARV